MSDTAIIALSAAATVITVAVVVWWVISKVTAGNRAVLVKESQDASILSLQAQLSRKDQSYEALKRRYLQLAGEAVGGLSDDDLVALAGGTAGDPDRPGAVARPGGSSGPGDGLLDPFADSGGRGTGDLPGSP